MELLVPDTAARGGVLVVHSWWGLTDPIRRLGDRLRRAGFAVGLADLYGGQTATTVQGARQLKSRRRSVPMYRQLGRDLEVVLETAGHGVQTGVVGFSMGGHWAVWLSQRPEYSVSAAVLFYAARAGSFADSEASYLAHFAERDEWLGARTRRTMEVAIASAGRPYEAHDYADTEHGFAEAPGHDSASAKATVTAFRRTIDFLGRELAPPL